MRLALVVSVLAALALPAAAQSSLRAERGSRAAERKALLDANRVALTVFNTGLPGGVGEIRGNWPLGSSDFYLGDRMLVVAAEVVDDAGQTVPVVSVPRGPLPRPARRRRAGRDAAVRRRALTRGRERQSSIALKTTHVLWPPKPNAFESAIRTSRSCGVLGV